METGSWAALKAVEASQPPSLKQGVSATGNRGTIQAKAALEGWRLGQAIVDSQGENLLRGDERRMPARRQCLLRAGETGSLLMRGGLREPGWGLCQSPPELLLLMQLPLWLPHTPQGSSRCLDFTISLPRLRSSGSRPQCCASLRVFPDWINTGSKFFQSLNLKL